MCTEHDATASHEEIAGLVTRRGFLRTAAVGAAGVAVAGATGALATPAAAAEGHGYGGGHRVPPGKISIQLYTLRDQLAIDLEGTLAALAGIGYRRVEHAGFVGRSVGEFKAALDAAGLWASSGHVAIPQPFDRAAWQASLADARVLGSRYIVHPFFGIDFGTGEVVRDRATWTAFAHDLNRAGRMAREAGLRLGYHNHNWEFFRLDDGSGQRAYDVLVRETDPRYVHFELDLFWAWRGAADPVDLFGLTDDRVRQYHVKDLNQAGSFADPGQGLIDFARIFRAHAVDEYIVERDDAGSPPRAPEDALDTARVGYEFLRTVRF
jgi:sugar phosphate isomerase/epimerase